MATIINNVRWADNTAELKKNLLEGVGTIEAMKSSVDRTAAALGGQGLFLQANKVTAAIQELGGVTKLTASEQERANTLLDKAIEKYKLMGMTAPPAMVALRDAIKSANAETGGFTAYLEELGHSFVARVAEGVLLRDVVREFIDIGKSAFENAAAFKDLSLATGLSTDAIQKFSFVGTEFGLDTQTMARGVEQLSAKLATGDKNAVSAVASLGLSVKSLLAEGPEQAFLDVAEAVGHVEDPMTKGGIAAELFGGKLAKTLLPALGELKTKINEVPKSAIISQDDINNAHDLEVGFGHLVTKIESFTVSATMAAISGAKMFMATSMLGATGGPKSTFKPGGSDIELPKASLDNATILQNKLDSLRKDSLEPLTAAQQANIVSLMQWGESESEVANDLKVSAVAVHLYVQGHKDSAEAVKKAADEAAKFQKVIQDINSVGTSWQDTLQGINGAVLDQAQRLVAAGAAAAKVGQYYGFTEEQTRALGEQQKFLTETSAATAKEFSHLGQVVIPDLTAEQAHLQEVLAELDGTFNEFHDGLTVAGDTISTVTVPAFMTLMNVVPQNTTLIKDATAATSDWINGLGSLDRALSELARNSDGSLATVAKDLAGMVQSFQNTQKGIAQFTKVGATTSDKVVGGITAGAGFLQATAGGQGEVSGAMSGAASGALIGSVVPGIGTAIGAGVGALVGFIRNMGASAAELAGRDIEAKFEQGFGGFSKMLGAVGAAYVATGRTAEQAQADVAGLLAAEKQGGDAAKAWIDKINGAFTDQTQDAADLQTAIQKYGFTLDQLGPTMQKQQLDAQAQTLINDWRLLVGSGISLDTVNTKMASSVQDYLNMALKTGQEVPAAMKPILQSMIDQGTLTDANGNKITDMAQLGVSFSETMTEGFQKVVDKLDQLLEKLGLVPAIIAKIPTTIDVGVHFDPGGLPAQPMAAGGSGRVTRPTLFLAGEAGAEDYAFSGGGRSFSGSGGGGDVSHTTNVYIDGKLVQQSVERIQTRTLQGRRKLAAA